MKIVTSNPYMQRHLRFLERERGKVSPTTLEYYYNVFKSFLPYEDKYKKDLCEFNKEEAEDLLSGFTTTRQETFTARKRLLERYYIFCAENEDIKTLPYVMMAKPNVSEKISIKLVDSPTSFQQYMDSVFRPVKDKSMHNIFRVFLWLGYMGVELEKVIEIKRSDVDLKNKTLTFEGKTYNIPEEAIPAFEFAVTSDRIRRKSSVPALYERVDKEYLLSSLSKTGMFQLQNQLSRFYRSAEIGNRITFSNAVTSGFCYDVFVHEQDENNPVSAEVYIRDEVLKDKGLTDVRLSEMSLHEQRTVARIVRTRLKDYLNWRECFYPLVKGPRTKKPENLPLPETTKDQDNGMVFDVEGLDNGNTIEDFVETQGKNYLYSFNLD